MHKQRSPALTAADLLSMLAKAFSAPQYAFLSQVRNGTGYQRAKDRTADALAMSLWPSRGLGLYGFEIKVSRADWKRELKDPAKAEDIQRFCNRWYIVTPDESIIAPGELPDTWGWLFAKGKGLLCKKEAPNLSAEALDMPMLCAILRRVHETMIPRESIREQIDAAVASTSSLRDIEYKRLKERVEEFEKASGVCVEHWNYAEIGDAVRVVMANRHLDPERKLKGLRDSAARIIEMIDEQLGKGSVNG